MVIDTSALIAILFQESEAARFATAIELDGRRLLAAASMLELSIVVMARHGEAGCREQDLLIHKAAIDVVPVTAEQAAIGRLAFQEYGKGRHPARLNFGDCFAYALAKASGEPLLFKGDDFAKTDVAVWQLSDEP